MKNRIVKSAFVSLMTLLLLFCLFPAGAFAAPDESAGENPPVEAGAAGDDADLFIRAAETLKQNETGGHVFAEVEESAVRSNGIGEEEPDFVLPASLTEIGEEAFAGSAFRYAALSEQTVRIGSKAFTECRNLAYVRIPNAETVIEADAFDEGSGLTIIGVKGSWVEEYALAHNFAFRSISGGENNVVHVTFRTSAYTAKLSALGETTTVDANGTTFNLIADTVVTVTSATAGYNSVDLTAAKGFISGNTYTVPNEDDYVLITLVNTENPISVSATGGTLTFRNNAGTVITAAETGETVLMTATPNAGYESLNSTDFSIKRLSDGEAVSVGTTSTGWYFTMPAGGVQVNAEFRSASSVRVFFRTNLGTARLSALGGGTTVTTDGKDFYPAPGTVVTVTSETPGYSGVIITAQKGSVSGNRYTVPNEDDYVVITLVPDSTKVSITFFGQNGAYRLTMNGDTGVFTGSSTFDLDPGSIVSIMPEASGFNFVEVQSTSLGTRSGLSVNYTVPATSEIVRIRLF